MSPCSKLVFVHCPHTAAGGGLLLGTEDEDRSWAVRTAGMCPRLSPTRYTGRCKYNTWPVDGSKPRQVSLSLSLSLKKPLWYFDMFLCPCNFFFLGEELQKLCKVSNAGSLIYIANNHCAAAATRGTNHNSRNAMISSGISMVCKSLQKDFWFCKSYIQSLVTFKSTKHVD